MNQTPLASGPSRPTPDPSPREATFWWLEIGEGTELDEDGFPEEIQVQRSVSARIIEPEPGKVIESPVFLWGSEHQGSHYALLGKTGDYHAIRTDAVRVTDDHQSYRMRTVVLDEPGRPLAWEVLRRDTQGVWRPLEDQHLRPRTALAEEWLAEIGPVLTRVTAQERQLTAHRQALGQAPFPGHLRVASMPTPPSLTPPAPPQGPDPRDRPSLADQTPHQQPDQMLPLNRPAPVPDPAAQWAPPLGQSLEFELNEELWRLTHQLQDTHALVGYLRQQRGTPVTLLQTSIEERRAEILPKMPLDLWVALRCTPSHRMRT